MTRFRTSKGGNPATTPGHVGVPGALSAFGSPAETKPARYACHFFASAGAVGYDLSTSAPNDEFR